MIIARSLFCLISLEESEFACPTTRFPLRFREESEVLSSLESEESTAAFLAAFVGLVVDFLDSPFFETDLLPELVTGEAVVGVGRGIFFFVKSF